MEAMGIIMAKCFCFKYAAPNNAIAPIGAKLGGCGINRLKAANKINRESTPNRK